MIILLSPLLSHFVPFFNVHHDVEITNHFWTFRTFICFRRSVRVLTAWDTNKESEGVVLFGKNDCTIAIAAKKTLWKEWKVCGDNGGREWGFFVPLEDCSLNLGNIRSEVGKVEIWRGWRIGISSIWDWGSEGNDNELTSGSEHQRPIWSKAAFQGVFETRRQCV